MRIRSKLQLSFALYLMVALSSGIVAYWELSVNNALNELHKIFFLVLLAITLLGVILSSRLAAGIASSIMELNRSMRRIANVDSVTKSDLLGTDEITSLENSFSEMESRINNLVKSLELAIKNLHTKQEQLVASEKLISLGRIAAGVAHEINNPLSVINEKAGLIHDLAMMSKDHPYNEKIEANASSIIANVKRSRAITHQLLGYARHMVVTLEEFDLNAAIQEVIEYLEKDKKEKNVRLELSLKDSLPVIRSDRGQVQQVFLNIIKNAIDAVEEHGTVSVTTSSRNGDGFRIVISDNGNGMHAKVLEHVFEPFFTTKAKGKGTGLGLFITHGIVKQLGGDISVQSTIGKGTTFTIDLPLRSRLVDKKGEEIEA